MHGSSNIEWRAPRLHEAAAIHAVYEAWAVAGGLTWRESLDEIEHEMTSPTMRLDENVRVAAKPDGTLGAAIFVFHHAAEGFKHRGYFDVVSRPGYESLELDAVRWGEKRCREIFAAAEDDMPRVIRVNSDARNTARIARLESLGFEIARYFVDMTRPLDVPIASVPVPDQVTIESWEPQWVRGAWETHCEAFADHWGSIPPTWEDWQHRFEGPGFRPDLSVVAVADDQVVAFSVTGVFPHDWETRGRKEGWIETLATRRAWRRKGLASALITESMRRFLAAGLDHAALDVDTGNLSGAFGLYTRLGFAETDRTVDLMKEVDPPGSHLSR
jgi:mycothiol synthase